MINNFKQNVNNPKSSMWRLTEVIALIAVFISAITMHLYKDGTPSKDNTLEIKFTSLQERYRNIKADITALQGEFHSTEMNVTALKGQCDTTEENIKGQCYTLQAKITSLQAQHCTLESWFPVPPFDGTIYDFQIEGLCGTLHHFTPVQVVSQGRCQLKL